MAIRDGIEIVASYYFPYEADLARSLLEANEIPAWLVNDLQVQQQWCWAQALGGVRVAVLSADAARARGLLTRDHSVGLVDEPEWRLPGAPEEHCPRCGGHAEWEVRRCIRPGPLDVVLTFLMSAPFRRTETTRLCASCGHRWRRRDR